MLELDSVPEGEIDVEIADITLTANLQNVFVKPLDVGKCTILEVSHETMFNCHQERDASFTSSSSVVGSSCNSSNSSNNGSSPSSILEESLNRLQDEANRLIAKKSRIEASIKFTAAYTKNQLESTSIGPVNVDIARGVIQFHEQETERLDGEHLDVTKKIDVVQTQIKSVSNQLKTVKKTKSGSTGESSKLLRVSLNVAKGSSNIRISFGYIVNNATWYPFYDVRVVTAPEDSLSVSYFAEVSQNSGEDWSNCELSLSTSNPAISADPPQLKSKIVNFNASHYYGGHQKVFKSSASSKRADDEFDRMESRASFNLADGLDAFPDMQQMTRQDQSVEYMKASIEGTGDAGSTVFVIPRKTSISSDNKPHKVVITARTFKPQLVHYCVPSVSPYVYIQAKTKNSSGYPLLASDNVSIYLDGNFISKSSIKQANTGEMFQLFIGEAISIYISHSLSRIP